MSRRALDRSPELREPRDRTFPCNRRDGLIKCTVTSLSQFRGRPWRPNSSAETRRTLRGHQPARGTLLEFYLAAGQGIRASVGNDDVVTEHFRGGSAEFFGAELNLFAPSFEVNVKLYCKKNGRHRGVPVSCLRGRPLRSSRAWAQSY